MLTREAILAADDLPKVEVAVPEWGGGSVWIRSFTGAERDAWEQAMMGAGAGRTVENIRARLVVLTAVDANGVRLFADEDADALGSKSARALDRLFTAAARLNGLTRQDVKDLAKNS